MKKILLLGLALSTLLACESKRTSKVVTLMSYNVGVFSKYQDNSMPGVAQLIRETGASYVGMSELDSCNTRNNAFQVKNLGEMLEWDYAFARAIAYRGGAYGDGVVCAQPALKKMRVPLSQGEGAEARAICVVETEECVFGATHLDHRSESAALTQMQEVNDWFAANYAGCAKPVFLVGDFNVFPDSEVIALAQEFWTLLSGTALTFPSRNPNRCIDYVFALKDAAPVEVVNTKVITEGTADLSDHLPLVVKVKF